MDRRTKIVATLGPASSGKDMIHKLIAAGVNVFRLNFSYGSHAQFHQLIQDVRSISSDLNTAVCILQDLQGPKIRVGEIDGGQIDLKSKAGINLTDIESHGENESIYINYPGFPAIIDIGNRVLLDDGAIELVVTGKSEHELQTRVEIGGLLKSHKGVHFPGGILKSASPTEKDLADLAFGLEQNIDIVALSFVYSADDVRRLRKEIEKIYLGKQNLPVIAKLERPEALENLDEIIHAADGVMVARGDLGIEMSPEVVPIAQKRIIAAANQQAKLVITATQMLESMIHNPRPTRAESTDVANAIFDGSDAVMLSGETAIGDYPVRSVETMHRIILQAETHLSEWGHWDGNLIGARDQLTDTHEARQDDALTITQAAKELAHDRNVTAIAVFTQSGRTATLMSKARPRVPILAFTPHKETYNRLAMLWGVIPYSVPFADNVEAMLKTVENTILETSDLLPGQQIVLISGFPVGSMCPPNLALLHTLRPDS